LLESRTELIAAGVLSSAVLDTIDMLPMRQSFKGPGSLDSTGYYTLSSPGTPFASDTRNLILWSVYAHGASLAPAPGQLVIVGTNLNPQNVTNPFDEEYVIKRIVIPGPAFHFSGTIPDLVTQTMHTGQFVCTSRFMRAVYSNGSVAQLQFNLGVYVRPLI
jgi:hypothetical protein